MSTNALDRLLNLTKEAKARGIPIVAKYTLIFRPNCFQKSQSYHWNTPNHIDKTITSTTSMPLKSAAASLAQLDDFPQLKSCSHH
ncbi:hypothetical protein AVEN_27322-1 [Araneus ventricosus]|uniref:Uncharacterized protein n=1 Tax=Araneus ventricosus TaxID=182803 RepID=A0A4Y2Q5G2_ARAVE|nr:hypothetical protein AVEN_27322-1 [Araneus ventricosus]